MRWADGMMEIGVQDRTKEAFQSMAVGELPALYSLAHRLVRDGAEDLVQETLIRAYRSFGALKEDEAGARWLGLTSRFGSPVIARFLRAPGPDRHHPAP